MAESELTILIKARNTAKAEFDKLDKQVKNLQGSNGFGGLNNKIKDFSAKFNEATGISLGFATAVGMASTALRAIIGYVKDAINAEVQYNSTVIDNARLIGEDVEQTSRLMQAADDLFVSEETLNTALKAAARQGIDVSVKGIKELSQRYLSLNSATERAKLLTDNFGRSGSDMGKLLEVGADGIDKAMAAISDNLVVTEESVKVTIEYKQSVDALNDSLDGLKYQVAQEVMPAMSDFNVIIAFLTEKASGASDGFKDLLKVLYLTNPAFELLAMYYKTLGFYIGNWADKIREANPAIAAQAGAIGSAGEDGTLVNAVANATQYFEALTEKMLFNKIAANMDAEAALLLANQMGLVNDTTYNAYQKIDELTDKYDKNEDGVISLSEKTAAYDQEIKNLIADINSAKDKTIVFKMVYQTVNKPTNLKPGDFSEETRDSGGVSGGLTLVGGRGPEVLDLPVGSRVYSNYESQQMMGGGGVVVNLTYAPLLSLSDKTEAQTKLLPFIKDGLRAAGY